MDFTNEFSVDAPVDVVFAFMLRADEVAPCVPGAAISEQIDDTHYKGTVKIKLGAVQMTYRGELEMQPDRGANTITLIGKGSDTRGGGGASGTFVTHLSERSSGGTDVTIASHVDVTGRVATFGRGIMQDVSNRMVKEFASCLESKLSTSHGAEMIAAMPAGAESAVAHEDASRGGASTSLQPQEVIPSTTTVPRAAQPGISAPPAELNVGRLIADITRSRIARGLRALAELVEP